MYIPIVMLGILSISYLLRRLNMYSNIFQSFITYIIVKGNSEQHSGRSIRVGQWWPRKTHLNRCATYLNIRKVVLAAVSVRGTDRGLFNSMQVCREMEQLRRRNRFNNGQQCASGDAPKSRATPRLPYNRSGGRGRVRRGSSQGCC